MKGEKCGDLHILYHNSHPRLLGGTNGNFKSHVVHTVALKLSDIHETDLRLQGLEYIEC